MQGLDKKGVKEFTDAVTKANDNQLYEMAKYCIDKLKERENTRGLYLTEEEYNGAYTNTNN